MGQNTHMFQSSSSYVIPRYLVGFHYLPIETLLSSVRIALLQKVKNLLFATYIYI